jgi:hypothetical protein
MDGGAWRAFSLADGEKEQTNEKNGKTLFCSDGDCRGGREGQGAGTKTGGR